MEIKFKAGEKQDAINFIQNIKDTDKVALLTHIDLDGLTCVKIINKLVKPAITKFISYSSLRTPLANELKNQNINKIIITDLCMDFPRFLNSLEEFAEILVIDHHEFRKDLNSEKTVFISLKGYCATFLCYYIFSEIINLENLDWLIALTCLSDWEYKENKEWLEKIYEKYNEKFDIENPRQGKFWEDVLMITHALIYFRYDLNKPYKLIYEEPFSFKELEKYSEIVEKNIKEQIKSFEKNKIKTKNGWFYLVESPYEITSRLASAVSSKDIENTYILAIKDRTKPIYKISTRHQDRTRNMPLLLQILIKGFKEQDAGGHIAASGGSVNINEFEEFKKRLDKEYINCPT